MTMAMLYGLNNCDTCKKARKWLDRFDVAHTFIDYRDNRQTPETLVEWKDIPWEQLAFPTVVWALAHFHESRGKTDFATYSNPTGDLARMWPPRKPAGV